MSGEATLPGELARILEGERERWRLGPGAVAVEPILNWGGFTNCSFRIATGSRTLHVKLAAADGQVGLRRWLAVEDHLARHYCAPQVIGWIDVPAFGRAGLVFEHVEGATWDVASSPDRATKIVRLLDRLHRDATLNARLRGPSGGEPPRTLRQCWELRYREQFEEDLKFIRTRPPPFVSDVSIAWMEAESQRVLALGREHPALDGFAVAPCHWDLWYGNVLIRSHDQSLCLLDWDGLSTGDPALDLATAVWANVFELKQDWHVLTDPDVERDATFDQRMHLHLRAILLDWTIDVLADWIDAEATPWGEQVRTRNEKLHQRHLAWYRERWG